MSSMKPWPNDTIALICCLKDDPHRREVPGSVEKPCFNCGETVMVSPATLASATKSEILCLPCYKIYTNGKPHVLVRTPAQMKEIQ